ncbi:MAG: DUF2312 domain-containing protein [Rhizobiales bacterium]|nr:DUF2312 domain-containing protein [Hyphomicrobiales bacterium]
MADEGREATNFAKSQLRALVERIERLEEEKQAIADDIREVYGEAKANGFDTKALRAVIKLRGQDAAERAEFEAVVELYRDALGLGGYVDTDLGQAAARAGTKDPKVRKAAKNLTKALGKPVEPTAEEKARGSKVVAFEKEGIRTSIAVGEPKRVADRAEASASERDHVRLNQDEAAADVMAPPRPPHPSVANPPFAHTAPKPGEEMPDVPPFLDRREPEMTEPRVAAE